MMKETKSQARKRQILTKKIQNLLLKYKALFLTLTFSDEILTRTNEKTRERIIKNYLKNNTALYIANRDYGTKKEREHYHALIIASTLNDDDLKETRGLKEIKRQINIYNWLKYGKIQVDLIGGKWRPKGDKNYKKTADNLSRHFRKPSTKGSRIIASRGTPTKAQQIERLKALKKAKQEHIKAIETESNYQTFIDDEMKEFDDYINNEFKDLINNDDMAESLPPTNTEKGDIKESPKDSNINNDDLIQLYWNLMKTRFK